ncbi:MAG TPA: hypothetical protein VKA02_08805 [Candidatus Acidoferrum sp.]|nr:hypothetical protein [Candidatus Acidoferrum sp.]
MGYRQAVPSRTWLHRSAGVNNVLGLLARCEVIPQKLPGTSLMAVLQIAKD